MSRDYDELIASAGKAMREKLEENSHKCGFDVIPIMHAIERSEDEIEELYTAHEEYMFAKNQYELYPTSPEKKERYHKAINDTRREAADVANFPAMIISQCDKMIAALEARDEHHKS